MPANATAPSGNNRKYTDEERCLLASLKQLRLSWVEIAVQFNSRVSVDRQRTASALENQWREIKKLLGECSEKIP